MGRFNGVGNPRFFARTGPHPLAVVAAAAGCASPPSDILLTGLAALGAAGPDEVSFLGTARHAAELERTRAGAVLVHPDMQAHVPCGSRRLVTADPVGGWAQVAALFHPMPCVAAGIHPSAVVAEDAKIDGTAEICAQAVIGAGAEIGPRCRIGTGAIIGDGVVLGPECRIGPHVSISHALLGARVYVYPGARIGQEGFGFAIAAHGFQTIPQLGCVILEDDVEVGANTTIDRGCLRDTVIGAGTRLDNLVQVAHNVRIGRYCAIAALVGISGSAEIGDFVVVAGQAGFADHVRVGARAQVGAQAGVMSAIEAGAVVVGSPARPAREVFREIATLRKIARKAPERKAPAHGANGREKAAPNERV
ncbi:MAG TPA: UDP-3-O-(3-hydroxymyristoyl)glucosamine N-acyltransferase [Acetobacteraceae bacterium]|nr:UDP-3-O-(3-hydroxymyristoyl)glucosamine N-acyltransferase [Acetobacteraceae bacterium]